MNPEFQLSLGPEGKVKIEFKTRKTIQEYIDIIKREAIRLRSFSAIYARIILSNNTYGDEFDQDYEIQILNINMINPLVPQLVGTFSLSYIIETSQTKKEYQFLLDEFSRKALFQRLFNGNNIQETSESDFNLGNIATLLTQSMYEVKI